MGFDGGGFDRGSDGGFAGPSAGPNGFNALAHAANIVRCSAVVADPILCGAGGVQRADSAQAQVEQVGVGLSDDNYHWPPADKLDVQRLDEARLIKPGYVLTYGRRLTGFKPGARKPGKLELWQAI